jgi:acetoin utilization protein AcuB
MSAAPSTVGPEQTLATAHRLMRAKRIRHLPVLRAGKLVGILSQRDLLLIETLPDVDPATVPVEDAMSTDVLAVSTEMPLATVATRMAERRLGSAVVMEKDRVVGLFTATDACRTLVWPEEVAREPRASRAGPAGGTEQRRGVRVDDGLIRPAVDEHDPMRGGVQVRRKCEPGSGR